MRAPLLCLPLILAACSPDAERSEADSPQPSAAEQPGGGAAAQPVVIVEENDLVDFRYTFPAAAAAIAALDELLRAEAESQRADLLATAEEERSFRRETGLEMTPLAIEKEWETTADTPALLALSALDYSFTGGAHPNYSYDVLLWDRAGDRRIAFFDLFADASAAQAALRDPFCAALEQERREKLGADFAPPGDMFVECPDLAELPIAPVAADGRIERLRVLISPYIVGPYAEGGYEVELPVTPSLVDQLKPPFQSEFAASQPGQ